MRTQPSSKAWRRNMRNTYRRAFAVPYRDGRPLDGRRLVKAMMRRYRRPGYLQDPANYPDIFGTNPLAWPKNKYQWRQQMGAKLIQQP